MNWFEFAGFILMLILAFIGIILFVVWVVLPGLAWIVRWLCGE